MTIPGYIPEHWHSRILTVPDELGGVHYLWRGWNNGEGHGKARLNGRTVYTHRHVYEAVHGVSLATWHHIDHLCCLKNCINVAHLERVSPGENTRRGPGSRYQFKPAVVYEAQRRFEQSSLAEVELRVACALDQLFMDGEQWSRP